MTYSIKRVQFLIKNEIKQKWRIFLIVIAISFAIAMFYYFNKGFSIASLISSPSFSTFGNSGFSLSDSTGFKFHLNWLPQVILYAASILTSLAFSEYHERESATFNLVTPATQIEKWSAKAFLFIIIFPILLIVFYQVFIWFTNIWGTPDGMTQVSVNIFDPYFYGFYKDTILMQCLIFAGAILYKKYSILKILLLLMGLYMLYNFFTIVSLAVINDKIDLFGDGSVLDLFSLEKAITNSKFRINNDESTFMGIPYQLFMYLMAFISIVFSYLRFKEIEA